MKKCIFLIIGLFVTFGPVNVLANEKEWTVAEIYGDVFLNRLDGQGQPISNISLNERSSLQSGDTIQTSQNARVVLTRGEESIVISSNSILELPKENRTDGFTQIIQKFGTLLFKVEKKPQQHFEVTTPYLAAVVKGTTFSVNVVDQSSAVHVVEGAVEVRGIKTGEIHMVLPGQTVQVSSSENATMNIMGINATNTTDDTGVSNEPFSQENVLNPVNETIPNIGLNLTTSIETAQPDFSLLTDNLVQNDGFDLATYMQENSIPENGLNAEAIRSILQNTTASNLIAQLNQIQTTTTGTVNDIINIENIINNVNNTVGNVGNSTGDIINIVGYLGDNNDNGSLNNIIGGIGDDDGIIGGIDDGVGDIIGGLDEGLDDIIGGLGDGLGDIGGGDLGGGLGGIGDGLGDGLGDIGDGLGDGLGGIGGGLGGGLGGLLGN